MTRPNPNLPPTFTVTPADHVRGLLVLAALALVLVGLVVALDGWLR